MDKHDDSEGGNLRDISAFTFDYIKKYIWWSCFSIVEIYKTYVTFPSFAL